MKLYSTAIFFNAEFVHRVSKVGQILIQGSVISIVFLATACGLRPDHIAVTYQSNTSVKEIDRANFVNVNVNVSDLRPNKTEVSKKGDEYAFLAPILVTNDVANVLRSAVESELKNRGFMIGEDDVSVLLELHKFYNRFKGVDSEAEIFFHAQVKNNNGDIMFSSTVQGMGVSKGVGVRTGGHAKIALESALSEAIWKLMRDAKFQGALLKASRSVSTT